MIKKIMGMLIVFMLGVIVGISAALYANADNQYAGAQKLISECQHNLKRSQICVLIAVEDEPDSATNNKIVN